MDQSQITPKLFEFLRELKRNNRREWFLDNKERYEDQVREPLQRFISDFAPHLNRISSHYRADPRPVGGSLFRIYRDVRFSNDKSPYKTHAGIHFRHEHARDVHAPGFYLHLEPENVFAAVGIWHPDSGTLRKIRDTIVEEPKRWQRVKSERDFAALYELGGESLKRPPQGYDADHLLIDDLKYKDFVAHVPLSEKQACAADFLDRYTEICRAAAAFMRFLTEAVGLPW